MATVHGYIRGSKHEQEETLRVQEATLRKESAHRFQGLTFRPVIDRGVSGKKLMSNRPAGMLMLAALEEGDVVMLTKLDRGFRNLSDLVDTLKRFEARKVRLVSLDIGIDTGTPTGRLMAHVIGAVAEFERERIAERTREVMRAMRARGVKWGGLGEAPWGFKWARPPGKRRKELVRDDYARTLGAKIVELIDVHRCSFEELFWHFLRQDVKSAKGKAMTKTSIHRYYEKEKSLRLIEALGAEARPATDS